MFLLLFNYDSNIIFGTYIFWVMVINKSVDKYVSNVRYKIDYDIQNGSAIFLTI